jgi:hypothetical protein
VWTAVIVSVLVMVGVGIVIDELLRLRAWLNKPPPDPEPPPSDPERTG